MRDDLHRAPQVLAFSLFVKHIPVHFSRRQVRVFVEIFIDKALIMTQIQIRLRTILRHVHFSMLIRTHGSRIHVDIRVQLLCCDAKSSRL